MTPIVHKDHRFVIINFKLNFFKNVPDFLKEMVFNKFRENIPEEVDDQLKFIGSGTTWTPLVTIYKKTRQVEKKSKNISQKTKEKILKTMETTSSRGTKIGTPKAETT